MISARISGKWKYLKTTTTLFSFPHTLTWPPPHLPSPRPPPSSPLLNNLPAQRTTHGHYWRHYAQTPPTHSEGSPASAKQGTLIQKSIWKLNFLRGEFDYFQQKVSSLILSWVNCHFFHRVLLNSYWVLNHCNPHDFWKLQFVSTLLLHPSELFNIMYLKIVQINISFEFPSFVSFNFLLFLSLLPTGAFPLLFIPMCPSILSPTLPRQCSRVNHRSISLSTLYNVELHVCNVDFPEFPHVSAHVRGLRGGLTLRGKTRQP